MTRPDRKNQDHLRHLVTALETGTPPDPAVADWAATGLRLHLEFQGWEPLDSCLGLREPSARLRKARRDSHLRHAWDAVALGADVTPWARSRRLAKAIRRFQDGDWPRWRDRDAPPPEASDVKAHLFAAFKIGTPPQSAAQLHDICRQQ